MAISTYKTFLMVKGASGNTYEKVCDIKSFPDLGGEPEMLETTTCSDKMQTNILGIQSLDALSFTANYDSEVYDKLVGMANIKKSYAVWFGGTEAEGVVTPTGTDGKFAFDGELSVYVGGAGVNEVVEMTISIACSTVITKASA